MVSSRAGGEPGAGGGLLHGLGYRGGGAGTERQNAGTRAAERRAGGAILPSGTYYSQVPTTVLNDCGTVDGHALDLLPEMVARYAPDTLAGPALAG
jgi:hypothetical protein